MNPCMASQKMEYSNYTGLVFYYDEDLQTKPEIEKEIRDQLQKLEPLTRCFSSIEFTSAKLKRADNGYPRGPSNQFVRLFSNPIMSKFDYWMMMEPDVVAIRPLWLDKIYEETTFTVDDFWIKGSTNRNPRYNAFHMNGNAIYKLHDTEFESIVVAAVARNPQQALDLTATVKPLRNTKI